MRVARPGKWGNPFRIGIDGSQAECVSRFRAFAAHKAGADPTWLAALRAELGGKNLACWCRPGSPCHADVLLELAAPGAGNVKS